jgi:hypothetical protein
MELPWLKNKTKHQGGGGPTVVKRRPPDGGGTLESDLMDQVVDELFQAIEKKDKALLREALKALVLHIQDEDAEQDEETMS